MDWSSVFEDEHKNEHAHRIEKKFVVSRLNIMSIVSAEHYSPSVCYCFVINYILGVGCLGMPYSFYKAGLILGLLCLAVNTIVSFLTTIWIAEASYVYKVLMFHLKGNPFRSPKQLRSHQGSPKKTSPNKKSNEEDEEQTKLNTEKVPFYESVAESVVDFLDYAAKDANIDKGEEEDGLGEDARSQMLHAKRIEDRTKSIDHVNEPELVNLLTEFCGQTISQVYQYCLCLLTYVGLIAYTQVFCTTWENQIGKSNEWLSVFIFGIIVLPLSCFDLDEQIQSQVLMSGLRFLTLIALSIGLAVTLLNNTHSNNADEAKVEGGGEIPLFEISGFGLMFSNALFSQLFQHSVLTLIRPLNDDHHVRTQVPTIFAGALMTTSLFYVLISVLSLLVLGDSVEQSININFINNGWGFHSESEIVFYWIARALSLIIVLFPALDTLSIFPLICNTLGNSLRAFTPDLMNDLAELLSKCNTLPVSKERMSVILFRMLGGIPPIIIAIFIKDLAFTLTIAGICGIIVALVIPSLLCIITKKVKEDIPPSSRQSPYLSHVTDSIVLPYIVIIVSLIALSISVTQFVNSFL